jgi:dipeptidyl aminopeptidase/acylaminoacyl peptidase
MLARTLTLVVALVMTSFTVADEPVKKPFAIEDLYRFDAPTSARLSRDGTRLVYVRQWIDAESKRPRHSLWLVEGKPDAARPLEKGEPDARAPVFSPDGKWIAFLSTREVGKRKPIPRVPPQSDPATDIWLISVDGKKCVPLAGDDKPFGRVFNDGFYGRLAFSPDGKHLAFIADDGKDPRTREEIANDVEIVRDDQGEGYTGYGAAQLWLATLDENPETHAAKKIERLTNDDVWYGDPQWSPDSSTIAMHANKTSDRESVRYSINKNYDIWALDVKSKKQTQLTNGPGPDVSPRFSPDGKKIVCLSIPRKGTHMDAFSFTIVHLRESGAETEVLFDHHGDPKRAKPPHPAPSFPLPDDCWVTDRYLTYPTARGAETVTGVLSADTGQWLELFPKGLDPKVPLLTLEERLKARAALIPRGNRFLAERQNGETRTVHWTNGEQKVEGVLTIPPPSVAKPPYKLLVYPHGGPHSRSTLGFNFTAQLFAAHGYLVLQPNFRGSTGYGQKFIDADRGDFGGGDMRDILAGIDHLVEEKLADPKRQFVYGSSYGGFMTTWLVGHTNQFKAAVAQNAVTDLNAMWGLSDIQSWTEWEFGGKPWQVPAAMRKHSPLTHAADVKTPTLILHARDDRRVPLPMGRMFYQALKSRGVPTQMVIYPDEGHGIKQPRHQEDVLRRTLAWFEKYEKE